MENEIVHMPEQIQELTLLLMYLTSWQERRTIGLRRKPHKTDDTLLRRCWKGYDFSVLERLEAQGLKHGYHPPAPRPGHAYEHSTRSVPA